METDSTTETLSYRRMLNLLTFVGALALTPAPAVADTNVVAAEQPATVTLFLKVVTTDSTAAGVAGAVIEFVELGATLTADEFGKATAPAATLGTHTIKVSAPGFAPYEKTVEVTEAAEVVIPLAPASEE